jgi:glycerol-3-phosphate acyltransferase PlsX
MGGDHAPAAVVAGTLDAARAGIGVALVGDEPTVRAELARLGAPDAVPVVHAPDRVPMDDLSPALTVRANAGTSISVCMTEMRRSGADAVVTMGHTGAGLAAALLRLGRAPGVRRPALASPFPTQSGPCVLIDIGANVDVKPEHLVQFAVMGSAYARGALAVPDPRVGLVSIGEEAGKGSELVHEAFGLLEQAPINFVGNIEGRDIPAGTVDVAVMDGFTGNVLIKFAEGLGSVVGRLLNEAIKSGPLSLAGGALLSGSLRRMKDQMDYRTYGGAALLGVRGMVVIGHGRSDARAVKRAIEVAARGVEADTTGMIERSVQAVGAAE